MGKAKKQNWEKYSKIHMKYVIAINQARMISLASTEALADFPNNLPENIQQPFKENMTKALKMIGDRLREGGPPTLKISWKMVHLPSNGEKQETSNYDLTMIKANNFFIASFILGISKSNLLGNKIPIDSVMKINFDDALYFQELVMIFAYLDAFIDDTLRIIYECCPERLKCEKTITWETAIGLKSYKKLIHHLISKYVRKEFRNLPLVERIAFLKERMGLEMDIPESVLRDFKIAEHVRHIIVHNAGRIDNEFLAKTQLEDFKIGDVFPISFQYISNLSYYIQLLGSYIFREVSTKYFKVPDSSIDWAWRFPKPKANN